jgi:hypothetical protein
MPIAVTQLRVQRPTTAFIGVEQIISPVTTGRRALILQGQPGQTANLLECQSSTTTPLATISSDGWLRIGAPLSGSQLYCPAIITAPFTNQFSQPHLMAITNDALAADKGGAIGFGGVWTDTGGLGLFARISGYKDSAVSAEGAGYMSFWTRYLTTGNLTERLRIPSAGGIQIRTDAGGIGLGIAATGALTTALNMNQNPVQNASYISLGATPSTSDAIRLTNNTGVNARNAANTGDINLIRLRNDDVLVVGDGSHFTYLGMAIGVGAGTYASTGMIRMQSNQTINWRNAANTADVLGLKVNVNDAVELGGSTGTVVIPGTSISFTNAAGMMLGTVGTQKIGFWGTAPAIQNTGWSVTAGYTADRSFNPASTTLNETAAVLGTLIDTLKSYGLLAA